MLQDVFGWIAKMMVCLLAFAQRKFQIGRAKPLLGHDHRNESAGEFKNNQIDQY
jgi:hypothetical protein